MTFIHTTYFVDFDHTISKKDVWDSIVRMFAPEDWKTILSQYLEGKLSSRLTNQKLAKLIHPKEKEARALVLSIGIDPTFHDFNEWVRESNSKMIVVSDGYDYYIDLLFEEEDLEHLTYFSNRMRWTDEGIDVEFPYYTEDCEIDMANCKCQHLFKCETNRRVYIGDGVSDVCAAKKCDEIYAKRNLLEYCQEHGIECTPFNNFQDIIQEEKRKSKIDSFATISNPHKGE